MLQDNQEQHYKKTKDISKKELKQQREAVKTREQKHRLSPKLSFWIDSGHLFSNYRVTYTITFDENSLSFPSRGESSSKRKRRSNYTKESIDWL